MTMQATIQMTLITLFALSALACANSHEGDVPMTAKSIEAVLQEQTDSLMAIEGVVGTARGLCDGKPCIKVYVVSITPELERKIPSVLEGFEVEVTAVGEIFALPGTEN
jgi:hypothetical protein